MDPRPVLQQINGALEATPGLEGLRNLRERLDDQRFETGLVDYYAQANDPDIKAEIVNLLRKIRRRLIDAKEDKAFEKDQLSTIGIGGGVSLIGGGILAVVTVIFPLAALVPILGGGVIVARSVFSAREINRERAVLEQMDNRVGEILERL